MVDNETIVRIRNTSEFFRLTDLPQSFVSKNKLADLNFICRTNILICLLVWFLVLPQLLKNKPD